MYINRILVVLSLLFIMICSVHAGNIGRNVYSVYSESLTGVNFEEKEEYWDDDSIVFFTGGGVNVSSYTTGGVEEGVKYNHCRFPFRGPSWFGYSFVNKNVRDMSDYYDGELKMLIRIKEARAEDYINKIRVGIECNEGKIMKTLAELGYDLDKTYQWQEITLTLNENTKSASGDIEITRENLKNIACLFLLDTSDNPLDSSRYVYVDIDYIRWVKKDPTGDYSVKLKNLSDPSSVVTTNNITWSSSNFQQGWQVADQFLEIDYDVDSSTRNWSVKIYTDNGNELRNGLYATKNGKDYVMTMCWRASENALPYTDGHGNHTLQIAQGHNSDGDYDYLYDSGSSSTDYAPWLYMQDLATLTASTATDKDIDYSTVMGHKKGGNSGYHGYSGNYYDPYNNGYYTGRKINLYLGANCDVGGGLRYTGNIVVVLEYE